MKVIAILLTIFFLSGFSRKSHAQAITDSARNADTTIWIIRNRQIPPPAGASEVLRSSIAATSQPDYDAPQDVPKDDAGWKALQNRVDSDMLSLTNNLAERFHVKVEQATLNDVPVYNVTPPEVSDTFRRVVFFSIHGGSYLFASGKSSAFDGILDAGLLKILSVAVDYRMPPEHPYPAAIDDVIRAYKGLLKKYPGHKIIMGGSSAGGGLTMAAVLKMKELHLQLPDILFLGTPWSDLTKTGDSYYINEGIDRGLATHDGLLEACAKLYANGHDLKDPYLSPVYGDLSGFPPTFLVTGTRDLFLSNTVRVHRKLRDANVDADLVVIEGMSHGEYVFLPDAPESQGVFNDLRKFLEKHL